MHGSNCSLTQMTSILYTLLINRSKVSKCHSRNKYVYIQNVTNGLNQGLPSSFVNHEPLSNFFKPTIIKLSKKLGVLIELITDIFPIFTLFSWFLD